MSDLINIRVLQHDTEDQIRIGMAYPVFDLDKAEQEFMECVESPLEDMGILVDGLRLRLFDYYPTGESFDYMFFDYGGMSVGNSLMESLCRHITNEAEKYPSRSFIIVSTFTQYAMRDTINEFGRELPNIFLSLSDFVESYKRYGKF